MPVSNYPSGFAGGITLRGVPVVNAYMGNVFWVDSVTGSDGNRGTFTRPFATLDYAVGQCTANNGDVIFVKAGHTETYSAASALTLDVAGIAIIGLGSGRIKPKFTYDTADTTSTVVSAANVAIKGLRFSANFADITQAINLTAVGFTMEDCDFRDTATNMNWLSPVKATSTTDNTADDVYMARNTWYSPDAAGLAFLISAADITGLTMIDHIITHEGTGLCPLVTMLTGKDARNAYIARNFLSVKSTANDLLFSGDTASPNNSGVLAHNRFGHADVTGGHTHTSAGGFRLFDNLSTSVDNLSGYVLPAIDVNL